MKFKQLPAWAHDHFDYFLDLVRIYLGIGLIFKGISFLTQGAPMLSSFTGPMASLAPVVPYIHIIGGLFLAAGVFTRVAAAIQIPILSAALLLVHLPQIYTLRGREGVEFSALVLFLLVLITIPGTGPMALGGRLRRTEPSSFQRWLNDHSDVFADAVRIYLGVGLIMKGLYIMGHRAEIFELVNGGANMPFLLAAAAHYVIPAHFVGGALLLFGLLTRASALIQLPPLLGAIFYAFLPGFAALEMRQSFEFTTLVLFLLSLIAVFGAGRFSVENCPAKTVTLKPAFGKAPTR